MSGTFWKRKSSLLHFGGSDENAMTNEDDSVAASTNETLVDDQPMRSTTPMPGDEIQGIKKRKSGTFWKRKSNLSLFNAYNSGEQNGAAGTTNGTNGSAKTNGYSNGHQDVDVAMGGTDDHTEHANGTSPLAFKRSASPPPQLPAFVGGGGGLGLGMDDIFKGFD